MIEALRKQILADTGLLVVPANTTKERPKRPFATMNLIVSHLNDVGHPDLVRGEDENGAYLERREAYQVTLSFTFYGHSDYEAAELARTVRIWFDFHGYEYLSNNDLVVTTLGNIENRTTFLVDSYDYKHGFDVRLRTTRIDRIAVDSIGTVEVVYDDRKIRMSWEAAVDLLQHSESSPVIYLRAGEDIESGSTTL